MKGLTRILVGSVFGNNTYEKIESPYYMAPLEAENDFAILCRDCLFFKFINKIDNFLGQL